MKVLVVRWKYAHLAFLCFQIVVVVSDFFAKVAFPLEDF